jgi:hypothetical protein
VSPSPIFRDFNLSLAVPIGWDQRSQEEERQMAEDLEASGCEEFDRARQLLQEFRDDEALDYFELASGRSTDAEVRASAAAFVAGILLRSNRPWEVEAWADIVRENATRPDLGDFLEAAGRLQLDDPEGARKVLARVDDPTDRWFPCSITAAHIARAHVAYLEGDIDAARAEVVATFEADPFAPEVWDAFARLCADTDFDPAEVVAIVSDDRTFEVITALRNSAPAGVDRIAELIWARNPGDARVLALVPRFASKLESTRAMEWSARMRGIGMGRTCPLLARAEDEQVDAIERVRACALAHAAFGDRRARELLERAVPSLPDDDAVRAVLEVWTIAPALVDSVIVAAATTPNRSLAIAASLFDQGAGREAYAVLVHGLSLEAAEDLTTDEVMSLLPVPVLEGLAAEAEEQGDEEVAGILEAVAVVAGER